MTETMMPSPMTYAPATAARALFLAALVAAASPWGAAAQGLESPEAIDTIIGSEVQEEETRVDADPERLMAAIDASIDSATKIRMTSNLETVEIVRVSGMEGEAAAAFEAKLAEHDADIAALRQELEGNAMLFHAIDSRSILLRDVVAVEFSDENSVTIYALEATAP
jgi:hypothetical protein